MVSIQGKGIQFFKLKLMKNIFLLIVIILLFGVCAARAQQPLRVDTSFPYRVLPEVLPGTKVLTWEGDLSVKMLDGAHKFIEEKINEAISNRPKLWNRNFSSVRAYEQSVEGNRRRFMKY